MCRVELESVLEVIGKKSTADEVHLTADSLLAVIENKFNGTGFAIAYMDHRVLVGTYINKAFSFSEDGVLEVPFLQRLRVFNEKKELMIWKSEDGLRGRLREDIESCDNAETENYVRVVDAHQVVWGTRANQTTGGICLTEKRGTRLVLPFKDLEDVDDKKNRVLLVTRNYVDFNEAGQATYVDSRFMGFLYKDKPVEVN
ncbi:MAG: TIGR03984 family CRISPR-associated protein [bacterium]|nr:TIGR03984 family CRISPR-associated protein [bacterium]